MRQLSTTAGCTMYSRDDTALSTRLFARQELKSFGVSACNACDLSHGSPLSRYLLEENSSPHGPGTPRRYAIDLAHETNREQHVFYRLGPCLIRGKSNPAIPPSATPSNNAPRTQRAEAQRASWGPRGPGEPQRAPDLAMLH